MSNQSLGGNVSINLSEHILLKALNYTGAGVLITDPDLPDNPIVFANKSFAAMTGYSMEEVMGRNCRFLQGSETDQNEIDKLRVAIKDKESVFIEVLNYKKDGTPFWNSLSVDPLYIEEEDKYYFVGVQRDVTARKRAEENYKKALVEIEQLSCPIVPLIGDIAALPLVGTMNEHRFEVVYEEASQHVSNHNIEKLIIDVSGLIYPSSDDLEGIFRLESLMNVMGTELLVTGITAEMAMLANSLNIDFPSSLKTAPTIKRMLEDIYY